MAESIGNLYSTAIPALSDTADIQEALRIYHYGAPSGAGTGQYPITNTDPSNLVFPSIAYHLYNLQDQIDNFEGGVTPDAWSTKGVLISASGPGSPLAITPGPDGQVLTTDTSRPTGLVWKVPDITETNEKNLSNKTLINTFIANTGIAFKGPVGNAFTITLLTVTPTANRTITFPDATTTLVGTDTTQTLTNKSIGASQITGILPLARGGTGKVGDSGDITPAIARSNLEIFNTQTANTGSDNRIPYSGKIYVADPGVVGTNGAGLDGAAAGDLWFW